MRLIESAKFISPDSLGQSMNLNNGDVYVNHHLLEKVAIRHITLPPAYLSCEFAFRARFQRVVRALDLNYVENAYHCISTHCEIHEYSLRT